MRVTVYSKPSCVQCTATTRALNAQQTPYTVIDLTKDEQAMALVTSMGYKQAPVIITDTDHWAGYVPEKIKALRA